MTRTSPNSGHAVRFDRLAAAGVRPQRFRSVVRAETIRLTRHSTIRWGGVLALVSGLLSGWLTVGLGASSLADPRSAIAAPAIANATCSLITGLTLMLAAHRELRGPLVLSLWLVPNRLRLAGARLAAQCTVALALGTVVAIGTALATAAVENPEPPDSLLTGSLAGLTAGTLMALVAGQLGLVLRPAVLSVGAGLGLFIVPALVSWSHGGASGLLGILPPGLYCRAVSPAGPGNDVGQVLLAQAGLGLWAVLAALAVYAVLRHREP